VQSERNISDDEPAAVVLVFLLGIVVIKQLLAGDMARSFPNALMPPPTNFRTSSSSRPPESG